MKIFGTFFEKMSSFWQFFDIQMAISRRVRLRGWHIDQLLRFRSCVQQWGLRFADVLFHFFHLDHLLDLLLRCLHSSYWSSSRAGFSLRPFLRVFISVVGSTAVDFTVVEHLRVKPSRRPVAGSFWNNRVMSTQAVGLTLRKIVIWLSKICQNLDLFFKLPKIVI